MNRSIYITTNLGIAILSACNAQNKKDVTKPNIVFILVDDLGRNDIGCYGSQFHETPNIDKLASEGMRFTNAYAACPVSSPTRASILTGKYPVRVDITDWIPGSQNKGPKSFHQLVSPIIKNDMDTNEITIAERLKAIGYKTACIGKWHLGDFNFSPTEQGFDHCLGGRGSAKKYFYPEWANEKNTETISGTNNQYITDRITDDAINFVKENKNNPFFLYFANYAVHIPLQSPPDLVKKYNQKLKLNYDSIHHNPVYAAMIENMDYNIGRLLNTLDSLGISENTIIVFFSDNGGLCTQEGPDTTISTNNYPLRMGKGYLYEGGIKEPLIIKWPTVIKNSSTNDALVTSTDFFALFMDINGLSYKGTDGKSFLPVLKQAEKYNRGAIFWHYPHYSNQGGTPSGAVRLGNYKLIEFFEDGKLELYNLKEDIREKYDLSEQMPKKTKELYSILKEWQLSVNAKMPTINTNFNKSKKD